MRERGDRESKQSIEQREDSRKLDRKKRKGGEGCKNKKVGKYTF